VVPQQLVAPLQFNYDAAHDLPTAVDAILFEIGKAL
jgi:hypothetical protein